MGTINTGGGRDFKASQNWYLMGMGKGSEELTVVLVGLMCECMSETSVFFWAALRGSVPGSVRGQSRASSKAPSSPSAHSSARRGSA